jgi:IPT/TIG domain
MKLNKIMLASSIYLLCGTSSGALVGVSAANSESPPDTGITNYTPAKPADKSASAVPNKLKIPPPPKETVPGGVPPLPAAGASRPEAVRTVIDSTSTVVGSGTCVSANEKAQRFVSYLELKDGMDKAPLTMHLTNGGFSWFRILVANQVVATEKSMSGKHEANLDLTGVIQGGTNQLVVQAAGQPGAKLEWSVTAPAVAKIDKVDPDEVLLGEEIKIKGKNFSTNTSVDTIIFNGGKKGQVTRAKTTELTAKVPNDAEVGENKVSVKVNGVESNKVSIKLRGIPELSGSNLQGVPPGQNLTIFGKNFSKDLSENQVYFGDTPASVVAGSTTQLTVVVPFIPQHVGHTPSDIRVQVGKIMSKNTTPVQVGPQMYSDPGTAIGPDTPTFSPQNLPRTNAY